MMVGDYDWYDEMTMSGIMMMIGMMKYS